MPRHKYVTALQHLSVMIAVIVRWRCRLDALFLLIIPLSHQGHRKTYILFRWSDTDMHFADNRLVFFLHNLGCPRFHLSDVLYVQDLAVGEHGLLSQTFQPSIFNFSGVKKCKIWPEFSPPLAFYIPLFQNGARYLKTNSITCDICSSIIGTIAHFLSIQ